MNREDNLCWYHGNTTRDQAEKLLKEAKGGDGVFLVRESNSSFGDYVLSVLHQNEVWHYQIRRHGEDAFFSIDDQTKIHGLDSLIDHYQNTSNRLVTQLKSIIKKDPPPNDSRSHGRTNLLHRATKEGELRVVSELLKCGYRNIDAKNQDGQTAVHLACIYGHDEVLNELIKVGAIVNCRDTKGNTPLHYACSNKNVTLVRLLIEANANVQARNNETGCVPMHEAGRAGNLEIIKELLAAGAPHMPRSASGEFPTDFARENNHTDITEYFESYTPPPAATFRSQWYHGTLDRNEAVYLLKEFAKTKMENQDTATADSNDITSGTYLVRYSDRMRGNFVLTLLFENQAKHFKIQNSGTYLYIDEGPFMTSLEHLIEHYKISSDGLPVNLKYPVTPKPKPPVPLFSTIPKKNRHKFSPSASADPKQFSPGDKHLEVDGGMNPFSRAKSSDEFTAGLAATLDILPSPPQRNLSVPNERDIGPLLIDSPSPIKEGKGKSDILRSLKLKSKGAIIMDGMRSLKKNKSKQRKEIGNIRNSIENIEHAKQLMKNISFTADLPSESHESTSTDDFYNIPKNNCAIVKIDIEDFNSDDAIQEEVKYFIESDRNINPLEMNDKEEEELYFTEAPKIPSPFSTDSPNTNQPTNHPLSGYKYNAGGYVVSKDIPIFYDVQTPSPTTLLPVKTQRLASQISTITIGSQRSESEFMSLNQQELDPKSPNYFIPAENLTLQNVLGQGEFGSVYQGLLTTNLSDSDDTNPKIESCPVAIKTLHDEHCKENRIEFLREASVMLQLVHHCIVRMIGLSKGPPLRMIQELVPLGSMLTYLQTHKLSLQPNFELKLWASQIANGMHYLEQRHFVHRDLAARNILLSSKHQAKISDFGLSRALGAGNDYYQASQGGKWPIKWYAPESFNFGTFSHASDVWSFGVTLWEMFSLGLPPYGDMKGVDVIKSIETGERLPKPAVCPDNVYMIMESCWNYHPRNRPTFKQLIQLFVKDPDYQNITELIQTGDIS